jgi:hypothetical protein
MSTATLDRPISRSTPRRVSASPALVVERIPWSELGPEFIAVWGRPRGVNQPEHLEILGPTGSGKSFFLVQILHERARRRGTHIVFIATKQADATVRAMGWPIVSDWRGVTKYDQVVYWPRTAKLGRERRAYQAAKIKDLLDHLWTEDSNTLVVFDEAAYIEGLDSDLKADVQMYEREGRSHGIGLVLGKQRVQGVQRDMHSETDWKIAFKMNDTNDNERLAELFGTKKEWLPVIDSLDRENHEFIIQHKLTGNQYISWVDKPIRIHPPAAGYRK